MNQKIELEELLESARNERAPEGAKGRTLAALGIGVGAAGAGAMLGAHSARAAVAAKVAVVPALLPKGIAAMVIAGGIVTAAVGARSVLPRAPEHRDQKVFAPVVTAERTSNVSPRTEASPVEPRIEEKQAVNPASVEVFAPPAVPVEPALNEPRSAAPVAAKKHAPPAAPQTKIESVPTSLPEIAAPPVSVENEIALLGAVRRSLALGNANEAARKLAEYRKTVVNPMLGVEAELLDVDVKLQSGEKDAAIDLAKRILARDPNGPQSARLRRIVARANP